MPEFRASDVELLCNVPFKVFTAATLGGPFPCQCIRCALYTMPNSPVFGKDGGLAHIYVDYDSD